MSRRNYQKVYLGVNGVPISEDDTCPECAIKEIKSRMKFMHLNLQEAIYKCSAADCMYPFRNFLFKDLRNKRIFKYQMEQNPLEVNTFANNVIASEIKPSLINAPATSSCQTPKMQLYKCLESREKIIPKKSKCDEVNYLLNVYNKSAKPSSSDSGKTQKISVANPLTLVQHLNRTKVKLIPLEDLNDTKN